MNVNDLLTPDNLNLIIKLSPGAVAVFDRDMKYVVTSEQWIKDYKLEGRDIIGRSHYEIFPEILSMPEWLELHKKALSGEVVRSDGEIWRRPQGEEFLKYEIHPWHTPSGEIGGIIMFTQLDTQLKTIESELRETNEICKRVMSNSPIGVALLETSGKWKDVNSALCDLLGYEKEELLKTDFQSLTHPDDLDIDIQHVEDLLSGKENSYLLEKRYFTKAGKTLWALLSATILRDKDGNPSFFLSQIVDITALKQADIMRENFISLVSHELRTPLTSIVLSLDSLEQYKGQIEDGLFDKYLNIAAKNSHRLQTLIGDIIDAERLQTNSFSYTSNKTSVRPVVAQAIALNLSLAEAYGISIDSDLNDIPDIFVDSERLVQVITNFMTNAIRFSPKGQSVSVKVDHEADEVTISVRDKGAGIPKEFQSSIFEKFMRVDNKNNRKQGGTGLGLYISKQIVETMGGKIGFESIPNQGTVFWCRFPALRDA